MRNLSITYKHIADILSFETSKFNLEEHLKNPAFDWDAIVIEGSKHLMLPAIYCRLKSKQLLHVLPEELELYLEKITSINRNRNKKILKQVHAISNLLNKHNIDHVFLKGSALLALGCYEDDAERMVGDIDILVSIDELHFAFKLIKNQGYNKTFGYAYETIEFRHLDRLISHKELAAIELHSDLLNTKFRNLIEVNKVLSTKIVIDTIAIPNSYYLSKHQILAWQLNDKGHFYYALNFKSFYDSLILNIYSNSRLLSDLLKLKFGQSYLELAKYYFKEFDNVQLTNKSKSHINLHLKYINNPFYSKLLKPIKQCYNYGLIRLNLISTNKFYRTHLLKKIFLPKK